MKHNLFLFAGILFLLFVITSCGKDDPEPISQKQSKLLAGDTDKSKTWKITSGTITGDGTSPTPIVFNDCFVDNTYTFRNNAGQNYDVREGASKCNSPDPDITESGSWALTQDGKNIIFHAQQYSTTASFVYLKAELLEVTSTSFKISFNSKDQNGKNVTINMVFDVMP